ncbi:MAG: AAA family ATPase [Deltaproteobacteria bacterium]|nr:AAA family ATPase [Deltaproteobacteria bacterium]
MSTKKKSDAASSAKEPAVPARAVQAPPPEEIWAEELAFLATCDTGPRPPSWRLTPKAVVTFIIGSKGEALRQQGASMVISEKFVGDRAIVERCVVTLAGERGLLLVGEPGTAKSMLSELLAAAVSNDSSLTVQGTAGTAEEHFRYGWNYSLLIAKGPHPEALVPSPVLTAMRRGHLARVEEITRCLPEVQDALVSIMSDRRLSVPELGAIEPAQRGFNVIATANLRDKGVSEMSAALKRRFNFETIMPIGDLARETELVRRRAKQIVSEAGAPLAVDDAVLEALVTVFRDLRLGRTVEGWTVEKPSSVMSTAEAVAVASSIGLAATYFPGDRDLARLLPEYLLGVVMKDEPKDRGKLLAYWDATVKRRAEGEARLWKSLHECRRVLEA